MGRTAVILLAPASLHAYGQHVTLMNTMYMEEKYLEGPADDKYFNDPREKTTVALQVFAIANMYNAFCISGNLSKLGIF
jgi:hypothetical protein